jgi:hypothetical protein
LRRAAHWEAPGVTAGLTKAKPKRAIQKKRTGKKKGDALDRAVSGGRVRVESTKALIDPPFKEVADSPESPSASAPEGAGRRA